MSRTGAMTLVLRGRVSLPAHAAGGGFDHGDVHLPSGRVFVAHTANGTAEVIDADRLAVERTLPGCAEGSGVLCTPDAPSLVLAARGAGEVLVMDPLTFAELRRLPVGPRPNGLRGMSSAASCWWRMSRNTARGWSIHGPVPGAVAGRPRWCVYDGQRDRFW